MHTNKTTISVIVLTLGLLGCRGAQERVGESEPTVSVKTQTVRRTVVPLRYMASGTLRGRQTAVLTSKAPGYIQAIRFLPGDSVQAGQVLFVLEDSELGAKLRGAEAGLEEARQALSEAENGLQAAEAQARLAASTYERFKALREKRAVAPQEFDEVEGNHSAAVAQKHSAEARVKRVKYSLERAEADVAAVRATTQVTAPFSGRVTERNVDLGNLAHPGMPLGVIEQAGALRAEVSVQESEVGKIQVGDQAEVWFEGDERPVTGRVSEVFQGVDVASRAFMVHVDLPEDLSGLSGVNPRPGMFVRVGLRVGAAERLLVPASAVVERGQLEMVYVVENGETRLRLVTVGERYGDQSEILSGLSDGDIVVTEDADSLREGARVVTP